MFPVENATARGLGKLILSPALKVISGTKARKSVYDDVPDSDSERILSKQELRLCLDTKMNMEEKADKLLAQESELSYFTRHCRQIGKY